MRFRPCIDLHQGVVKQIVGATLDAGDDPATNFTADRPAAYFAELYRRDGLEGGHVIKLGAGNEAAAREALEAFPGGMHIGGGIDAVNGNEWLECGAAAVIVTSYVFKDGQLHQNHLERMVEAVGAEKLVLDLSCARRDGRYVVATDRWQQFTDFEINSHNLEKLAAFCGEFLIHATDMEGKQEGIDTELVRLLGDSVPLPTTYAGGIRSLDDIEQVEQLGQERLDFTVGSALDLFGGRGVRYQDLLRFR